MNNGKPNLPADIKPDEKNKTAIPGSPAVKVDEPDVKKADAK